MTWPAVVFWLLLVWSATSRGPAILYLFGISGAFGTLQMIPGDLIGGANIVPQSIFAVALVAKVILQRGNVVRGLSAAIDLRRLGLYTAFLAYAVPTSVFLPRFFAGQLEVFTLVAPLAAAQPLQITFNNITQSGYIGLSVGVAVAISVIGNRRDFQRHYLTAALLSAVTLIATGLVDLATFSLGLGSLLDPFRNVSYGLLTDVEALGAKRVVGLMPEASAYGSLCVSSLATLAFLRPCFDPQLRRTIVPVTMGALIIMAAISTSSSAYVGLGILAVLFGINWSIRAGSADAPAREDLQWELVAAVVGAVAVLCAVALFPHVLDPVYEMIDAMVLKKVNSASYVERNQWTQVAWNALFATGGLGVGLGGARASNWFVSILSNTGVFGGLLMLGFVLQSFLKQPRLQSAQRREWRRGLRFTLLPSIVMGWLSGTIPDVGVSSAAMYGLLSAVNDPSTEGRRPEEPARKA